MVNKIVIILVSLLVLFSTGSFAATIPDDVAIIQWSGLTKEDDVKKVIPVLLKDGVQAYLAQINRFRGRNDMSGVYLIQPLLAKSREIFSSVHSISNLFFQKGAPTLVVVEGGASGQGDAVYDKSLLYFDGWKPIILREVKYGYSGACVNFPTLNEPCYNHEIKWEFSENEKSIQLIETVLYGKWKKETKSGKVSGTKTVNVYSIQKLSLSLQSTNKYKIAVDAQN